MAIPKFVVTAGPDGLNALMDLDIDGELDVHPLAGLRGQFTSNLKPGFYTVGRDGMYLVRPIEFTIDSNGKLNGGSGVELLAAVDGMENLQWTISFDRASLNGKPLDIAEWVFTAGAAGETLKLEDLLSLKQGRPSSPTWSAIGPRAWDITDVTLSASGALVFHREDGYDLPELSAPFGAAAAAAMTMTFLR